MMTHQAFLKSVITLLACITLAACNSDKISCAEDTDFCAFVDNEAFDQTGPIINDFLADQKKNQPTENLEELRDWLACISCVEKVEILCNSCILTLPAQSELKVDFLANGQSTPLVLDINMEERLSFAGYHE